MDITQKLIEELAPNAAAAKNGRDLVNKKKFSQLKKSVDNTVIWGECAGSGKNPYFCSADFIEPTNPVCRCSCPSRQFPCKHGLGLLYAYEQGLTFAEGDIPEDILAKREKIEKKQEKKSQEKIAIKEKAQQPKKVNKAAVSKKIAVQLEGIELAEKLLVQTVQMGLSAIDAKVRKTLLTQIKELGNYYINGIQTAFNDLVLELDAVEQDKYTRVIDQINYISALLKKSKEYLNIRIETPDAAPELDSMIEEQIGYIWKLVELMQHGLYEENAELMQLAFYSYDNPARKEFVDEGYWLNLHSGKIYENKNYRPYRATKFIKEDNSVFDAINIPELFIYPGDINPRARWESSQARALTTLDFNTVLSFAAQDYSSLVKSIKNSIKNPLMEKNPVVLIQLHKVYLNGEDLIAEDDKGQVITLKDFAHWQYQSADALKALLPQNPNGLALLVMMNNDIESGLFSAQPLSLITPQKVVRLLY